MQKTITWNRPWVAVVLSLTLCATLWHLSQWHASELTRATDCALWHSIKCGLLSKKKISWSKYRFRQKTRNSYIFASHRVFLFVLFVSVPIKEGEWRSVTNERTRPHPVCTHAMRWREESAVYKQTELKGLMDHTAYLITLWTRSGSVSIWFSFLPPCWVSAPGFNLLETCAHTHKCRQTGEGSRSIWQPRCCQGNHV